MKKNYAKALHYLTLIFSLFLAACGGGGGGGGGTATSYTVGGSISGLTGSVVLKNNDADNLTLSTNGPFVFTTALNNNTAYLVSVLTQPAGQGCTVSNDRGTLSGANIVNVAVACAINNGSAPAAPTSLVATALSESSISLTWTDNSTNETGFKVERATSASGPFTLITTTLANSPTFSDTGLTASTTYYYRVRATNIVGDSANTTVAQATTSAPSSTSPAAPSGLTATAVSASSITLSWTDNSANETGFKVERGTSAAGTFSLITTTSANVVSFSDTGLAASTTYYYRVRATNTAGDSANTTVASATTSATAPTTITLLPVNDNTIGLSSLSTVSESSVWQTNYWFSTPGIGMGCNLLYGVITKIQSISCARGLIKFNLVALAGKTIQSATLQLNTSAYGIGSYKDRWYVAASASPWSGSTVTWINYGDLTYTASISYQDAPTYSGQAFNLDQTATVRNWVSGAYANNGFAMALITETLRYCSCTSLDAFEFYSSEDTSNRGPKLIVTYQ